VSQKPQRGESRLANSTHPSGPVGLLSVSLWFVAVLMLALLAWVLSQKTGIALSAPGEEAGLDLPPVTNQEVSIPEFRLPNERLAVARLADAHTIIPEQRRESITIYEVQAGDSVFTISKTFDIKPETVMWANDDILDDNPNMLSIGQQLRIPAVDGVIYKWRSTDTIEGVARKFKADAEAILTWPDNNLDLSDPKIATGTMVMVPGGSRELRTWVVPTLWRANSGANKNINSQCDTSNSVGYGTGTFIWPANSRLVSGNDFWSGHLGLDIGAAMGSPIYATDSGVVVYSGSISGGYGLMVMIDHGNGFHSVYAHNSQLLVRCGQGVSQGQTIAYSGSTGNSTGPHLHFELRYMGAFVNPRDYLR
jgi:murein DD-endopeptidase MepM/ murein hydrolase activator NlpD